MEENNYRKGKKKRIRLCVRRKKCHLLRKRNFWHPSNQSVKQSSITITNTPATPTLTYSKLQDSQDQEYNISNKTSSVSSTSSFPLAIEPETTKVDESNNLMGRRIVEPKYLFEVIKKIHHPGMDCNFSHMEFQKEIRLGLLSKYVFKCSMCNKEETIYSENPATKVNVNVAAVEGIICTGNGFSQLDEICGALNMPCMAKKTFYNVESIMQSTFEECALEEISAAGQEEKRLAILNNEVDSESYPLVAVVADGSWPKRSFKSGYSSLSGCACIGYRTKKILFIGIRNKFCCICSKAEKKGIQIPEHICYKNWSNSATSMEEDIIAEGFHRSIEMHGIKYNMLIGDGDSSVINKLLVTLPYGPNLVVKKVECKNHLLRNFCTKMKLLGKKTNNHEGYVPVTIRKKVEENVLRLRKAVVCAIKYRKDEDLPQAEKVQNLKQDIRNSANHVFGKHELCAPYFCKRPTELNLVPELDKTGMWVDIQKHLSYLVNNAGSLLLDVTNNCAEQFNSVVAKFIGGKRVNFTSRGSYQGRCLAAVTSWNSEVQTHNRLQKKIANKSPGYYTKLYTEKRKQTLEYVRKRKIDFSETHETRQNKRPRRCEPDQNYGLLELEPDLPDEEYETKKEIFLASLIKTKEEIIKLEIDTRGQGDNDLWLIERRKRLTASKFGTICKLSKSTSCLSTVKSLLYSTFKGSSATEYGKQHESEAIRQFSQLTKLPVLPCGLFVDENDCYLGASPDGVIDEDAIIEVKCFSSCSSMSPLQAILKKKIHFCQLREGKLFLKRNHDYYYQVQGQLHVTGRKFCYFIIWTPHGIEYEKTSERR